MDDRGFPPHWGPPLHGFNAAPNAFGPPPDVASPPSSPPPPAAPGHTPDGDDEDPKETPSSEILTEQQIGQISMALRLGLSVREACLAAGIDAATYKLAVRDPEIKFAFEHEEYRGLVELAELGWRRAREGSDKILALMLQARSSSFRIPKEISEPPKEAVEFAAELRALYEQGRSTVPKAS